jgi:DNA (cytosine-5)-methyltransferase 1
MIRRTLFELLSGAFFPRPIWNSAHLGEALPSNPLAIARRIRDVCLGNSQPLILAPGHFSFDLHAEECFGRYSLHLGDPNEEPDYPTLRQFLEDKGFSPDNRRSLRDKTRAAFWSRKFERNVLNDKAATRGLRNLGRKVISVCECQIHKDPTDEAVITRGRSKGRNQAWHSSHKFLRSPQMAIKSGGPIPVIDLFAGPGGLGEGFSRYPLNQKEKLFRIAVSIEKDPCAHETLTLRAFFRQFPEGKIPDEYYQYLHCRISRDELFEAYPAEANAAKHEAQLRTLGSDPEITKIIGEKIKDHKDWVLIGGPPCQAYSLVGRSRMLGLVRAEGESDRVFALRKKKNEELFELDHRHTLYKEYLKIIADHLPPVFVMENVKGILSAKLNGKRIFPSILDDLKNPVKALGYSKTEVRYKIHSLVKPESAIFSDDLEPQDYLIRAEEYGIPQTRHRVILVGIREDFDQGLLLALQKRKAPSVEQTIKDLPPLTPGLSKGGKGPAVTALEEIRAHPAWSKFLSDPAHTGVSQRMDRNLEKVRRREQRGGPFVDSESAPEDSWYADSKLTITINHETRSHIREDLWRYFFCACYAEEHNRSPVLKDFPKFLQPKHRNVTDAERDQKFADRFRVQCWERPSTTITSHISKDGHYFIHPDTRQYRSLTVREAARMQTFPDNYRFEGPRTQQFHQVGNAVPPRLAYQIADRVAHIFKRIKPKNYVNPVDNHE